MNGYGMLKRLIHYRSSVFARFATGHVVISAIIVQAKTLRLIEADHLAADAI